MGSGVLRTRKSKKDTELQIRHPEAQLDPPELTA